MITDTQIDFHDALSVTKTVDRSGLGNLQTKVKLRIDDPQFALSYASLPNDGVGLMPVDFIIRNIIKTHPLALRHFSALEDSNAAKQIEQLTGLCLNKEDYFILNLAGSIGVVATAFHPKDVFVQLSHLTTIEWSKLIGGSQFEPPEDNPIIGLRGASRYLDPRFRAAFELECEAIRVVREEMGLTNVKVVVPFCRTSREADQVIALMAKHGLRRGDKGLEVFVTVETPCNAVMASRFARHVDGFLICPVNLSRLMLGGEEYLPGGSDMCSDSLSRLISRTIHEAKREEIHVGLMFEGCSDHAELIPTLVDQGIDSISFYPDDITEGLRSIAKAENRFTHTKAYY